MMPVIPRSAASVISCARDATPAQLETMGTYRDRPPQQAVKEASPLLEMDGFRDLWTLLERLAFAVVQGVPLPKVPGKRARRPFTDRDGVPAKVLQCADLEVQAVLACVLAGGMMSDWGRDQLLAAWRLAGLEVPE